MNKKLTILTFIGFFGGIITGIFIPNIMKEISFFGDIYINLLKALIIPILFFGITSAIINNNTIKSSKIIKYTIGLFVIMFILTFTINSAFVSILKPGLGFNFPEVEWNGSLTSLSLKEFFISIFPSNLIAAAANNAILPVIIFAFVFSFVIKYKHPQSNSVIHLITELNTIFNTILSYIIYFTPIAVFTLMGNTVANFGLDILKMAIIYIGTAWVGSIIIMLLVMILPVVIICKKNFFDYIKKVSKIWIMTLSTCSSAATLPTTIKLCNEELKIPSEITNIVVPLGCTIHMCGGAVSFSLLALFSCQMYGINISIGMYILMLITALIINMGAPGIPGGGIVIGATYLTIFGIPINFIGFYAGIYKLLDMAYTTLNVSGDITANCIIKEKVCK